MRNYQIGALHIAKCPSKNMMTTTTMVNDDDSSYRRLEASMCQALCITVHRLSLSDNCLRGQVVLLSSTIQAQQLK